MSDDVSSMLADAALVVSVLGPGLILKLVQWFSDKVSQRCSSQANLPTCSVLPSRFGRIFSNQMIAVLY
eukprot:2857025-Rhodomonas_salina.1